jgi:hypothetical protein
LPIEAERQEAEALISLRAAKEIGKKEAILLGETEHRNTLEKRENPLWENFPHK